MIALLLRRREAEQRRVDAFVAAIRVSGEPEPVVPATAPIIAVECVDTPHGRVWQLDADTRRAFGDRTRPLPRVVAGRR
jgi:hypothetical protein